MRAQSYYLERPVLKGLKKGKNTYLSKGTYLKDCLENAVTKGLLRIGSLTAQSFAC